jgi:hypothetical protein
LRNAHGVKGLGPSKTTLAVALRDYAYAVTATQGGCVQALCKINKYLRAAGLKPLKATKVRGGRKFGLGANGLPSELLQKVEAPLFTLTEQVDKPVFEGAKQKGFEARRLKNLKRRERAQRYQLRHQQHVGAVTGNDQQRMPTRRICSRVHLTSPC